MRIDTPLGKVLSTLLLLVAVVSLIGACSSSTGSGTSQDTATLSAKEQAKRASKVRKEVKSDPCALLDPRDLSQVTGIRFDGKEPGDSQCIYSSTEGQAAIALNFTTLNGASPEQAIGQATSTCDAGTVKHIDFTNADGGFSCTVKGVPTVGVTGLGVFAVLTGATLKANVPTDRILQDLATILQHGIKGP